MIYLLTKKSIIDELGIDYSKNVYFLLFQIFIGSGLIVLCFVFWHENKIALIKIIDPMANPDHTRDIYKPPPKKPKIIYIEKLFSQLHIRVGYYFIFASFIVVIILALFFSIYAIDVLILTIGIILFLKFFNPIYGIYKIFDNGIFIYKKNNELLVLSFKKANTQFMGIQDIKEIQFDEQPGLKKVWLKGYKGKELKIEFSNEQEYDEFIKIIKQIKL
jgi:hypothetical protein